MISRFLSFAGVTFEIKNVQLSDRDKEMYDRSCE